MSNKQAKLIHIPKKKMRERNQLIEITQMLELIEKLFKIAIINILESIEKDEYSE